MSFFDDMKAKAEELLSGNAEEISSQIGDASEQAQNLKDNILPGEGQDSSENNES